MPCKCSGYRLEKCRCKLVGPGFPVSPMDGRLMILTQKDSGYFKPARPAKRSFAVRAIEHFYEKCAGYNLRYCPFRGYAWTENSLGEALKELLVLTCFVLANLVVMAAIVTRITLHVSLVLAATIRWIKRSLVKKMSCNNETSLYLRYHRHDFSPPPLTT
ncbi:unnamed protein product [Chilo suppressalis]|uniref:Transposase DDE domain-containing protein n=1 Tax=Chilo suppressalis TaxID=168631 RepID=A0ABN8B329_CHISP|nr:unnamed protein product [Chilo suppressalis]